MKVTTDACLFGAWCAAEISKEKKALRILDIGTGTGLLTLMVRQKKEVRIDALEIDEAAAGQASQNAALSPWNGITIHCTDALHFGYAQPYDVVISNPPFYEHELESPDARRNKAHHGHTLRLEELFSLLRKALKPDGRFYLLLPHKRINEAIALLNNEGLFIQKKLLVSQSVKHPPFRCLVKGGLQQVPAETATLSIRDEQNDYSEGFVSLLRDYYLYL